MIGWLEGLLLEKQPPRLLVNVQGVGYELEAPMSTFNQIAGVGEPVRLHTHHLVREDAQALYAFASRGERDVFRMLLKVNGIGAKLALTVLSGMDPQTLARCVYEGDTVNLARLPGIGKKTAERMVIDLRDRLATALGTGGVDMARGASSALPPAADAAGEAVSALLSLGLKPNEASRRVQAVDCHGLACEDIVRLALQSLAK